MEWSDINLQFFNQTDASLAHSPSTISTRLHTACINIEIPLELNKLPDLNWVMVFTPATDSQPRGSGGRRSVAQSESHLDFMLHQAARAYYLLHSRNDLFVLKCIIGRREKIALILTLDARRWMQRNAKKRLSCWRASNPFRVTIKLIPITMLTQFNDHK